MKNCKCGKLPKIHHDGEFKFYRCASCDITGQGSLGIDTARENWDSIQIRQCCERPPDYFEDRWGCSFQCSKCNKTSKHLVTSSEALDSWNQMLDPKLNKLGIPCCNCTQIPQLGKDGDSYFYYCDCHTSDSTPSEFEAGVYWDKEQSLLAGEWAEAKAEDLLANLSQEAKDVASRFPESVPEWIKNTHPMLYIYPDEESALKAARNLEPDLNKQFEVYKATLNSKCDHCELDSITFHRVTGERWCAKHAIEYDKGCDIQGTYLDWGDVLKDAGNKSVENILKPRGMSPEEWADAWSKISRRKPKFTLITIGDKMINCKKCGKKPIGYAVHCGCGHSAPEGTIRLAEEAWAKANSVNVRVEIIRKDDDYQVTLAYGHARHSAIVKSGSGLSDELQTFLGLCYKEMTYEVRTSTVDGIISAFDTVEFDELIGLIP